MRIRGLRQIIALFFSLAWLVLPTAMAEPAFGPHFDFAFVRTPEVATTFQSELAFASLKSADGIGLIGRIGAEFAGPRFDPNPRLGIHVNLFYAGQFTTGDNEFGNGAITGGFIYQLLRTDRHVFAAGTDIALALASNEARIGLATPNYFAYMKDTWAIQPRLLYAFEQGRFRLGVQSRFDLLGLTDTPPPFDTIEVYVNYGAGIGYGLLPDLQLSLEASLLSWLTGSQPTQAWLGPGLVWEISPLYQLRGFLQWVATDPTANSVQPLGSLAIHIKI